MLPSLVALILLTHPILAILPDTLDDYKMVIAFGKPLQSSPRAALNYTFDKCVQQCWEDVSCVLAYQSPLCQLYTISDVFTVEKLSGGSKVAFRVKTTSCPSLQVMQGDTESTVLGRESYGVYITYTVTLASGIWTFPASNPLKCSLSFTFTRRKKGVWCIGLFRSSQCLNQTDAAQKCSALNGRLSGIEDEAEFSSMTSSAMAFTPSNIESVDYSQMGFWVDGSRKASCKYPATCNGTDGFSFSDSMMSSPGGYKWLAGQPSGLTENPTKSNCLYLKSTMPSAVFGIDDAPCSMVKSSVMCYGGYMCGVEPTSV